MQADVLTIGSERLSGQIVDSNPVVIPGHSTAMLLDPSSKDTHDPDGVRDAHTACRVSRPSRNVPAAKRGASTPHGAPEEAAVCYRSDGAAGFLGTSDPGAKRV